MNAYTHTHTLPHALTHTCSLALVHDIDALNISRRKPHLVDDFLTHFIYTFVAVSDDFFVVMFAPAWCMRV